MVLPCSLLWRDIIYQEVFFVCGGGALTFLLVIYLLETQAVSGRFKTRKFWWCNHIRKDKEYMGEKSHPLNDASFHLFI